jgi:hypothetical protein
MEMNSICERKMPVSRRIPNSSIRNLEKQHSFAREMGKSQIEDIVSMLSYTIDVH